MEGNDSTYIDLLDNVETDSGVVDDVFKYSDVENDVMYNEWFDKGILDDSAIATAIDMLRFKGFGDQDFSVYRDNEKIGEFKPKDFEI